MRILEILHTKISVPGARKTFQLAHIGKRIVLWPRWARSGAFILLSGLLRFQNLVAQELVKMGVLCAIIILRRACLTFLGVRASATALFGKAFWKIGSIVSGTLKLGKDLVANGFAICKHIIPLALSASVWSACPWSHWLVCLALLHVIDASLGDATLIESVLARVVGSLFIKTSQTYFSQASALCTAASLRLLHHLAHSQRLELCSSVRVDEQLSYLKIERDLFLALLDGVGNFIMHER